MTENPNEGLQVPENYLEVFTESLTTKPEVPAPTQAEIGLGLGLGLGFRVLGF